MRPLVQLAMAVLKANRLILASKIINLSLLRFTACAGLCQVSLQLLGAMSDQCVQRVERNLASLSANVRAGSWHAPLCSELKGLGISSRLLCLLLQLQLHLRWLHLL